MDTKIHPRWFNCSLVSHTTNSTGFTYLFTTLPEAVYGYDKNDITILMDDPKYFDRYTKPTRENIVSILYTPLTNTFNNTRKAESY